MQISVESEHSEVSTVATKKVVVYCNGTLAEYAHTANDEEGWVKVYAFEDDGQWRKHPSSRNNRPIMRYRYGDVRFVLPLMANIPSGLDKKTLEWLQCLPESPKAAYMIQPSKAPTTARQRRKTLYGKKGSAR